MPQITVTFDQAVADRIREAYASDTEAAIRGAPTDQEIATGIKTRWVRGIKRAVLQHEARVAFQVIEDAKDADDIVIT